LILGGGRIAGDPTGKITRKINKDYDTWVESRVILGVKGDPTSRVNGDPTPRTRVRKKEKNTTAEKFYPPQAEDVENYARGRGFVVDGAHFVDYYAARGWMYGKTKIRDWKAVVRMWQRNAKNGPGEQAPSWMNQ
jgi:hypothetical protein